MCQLAAECVGGQQGGEYVRVVVGVLPAGIGEQALAPLAEVPRSILVHLHEYLLYIGQPLSLWDGPNYLVKERIFLSADDVDHERPVGGAEGHGLLCEVHQLLPVAEHHHVVALPTVGPACIQDDSVQVHLYIHVHVYILD